MPDANETASASPTRRSRHRHDEIRSNHPRQDILAQRLIFDVYAAIGRHHYAYAARIGIDRQAEIALRSEIYRCFDATGTHFVPLDGHTHHARECGVEPCLGFDGNDTARLAATRPQEPVL
ncbi:MAG: hypothetical protein WDM89_11920 [Rhizomicrobium sp.]